MEDWSVSFLSMSINIYRISSDFPSWWSWWKSGQPSAPKLSRSNLGGGSLFDGDISKIMLGSVMSVVHTQAWWMIYWILFSGFNDGWRRMTWREESALPGTKSCFLNPGMTIFINILWFVYILSVALTGFESIKLPCDNPESHGIVGGFPSRSWRLFVILSSRRTHSLLWPWATRVLTSSSRGLG